VLAVISAYSATAPGPVLRDTQSPCDL